MSEAAQDRALVAWNSIRSVDESIARAAARAALVREAHQSTDIEAVDELARATFAALAAACSSAGFGDSPPPSNEGALAADEGLAQYLECVGAKDVATAVRSQALKRQLTSDAWSLWTDTVDGAPKFLVTLALALWRVKVSQSLLVRRKPAALVQPVFTDVVDLYSRSSGRAFDSKTQTLNFGGRDVAIIERSSSEGVLIHTLDAGVIRAIQTGLELLGSVPAHRLLRWEIAQAHERAYRGIRDARVLIVDGGWSQLTRDLGLRSRFESIVRDIVVAQARWLFKLPDGTRGNLVSFTERPARGQRRARVVITVGPQLLPHYVHTLETNSDRKLVPILRSDPPLCSPRNYHGSQLTMALALTGKLRAHARELASDGGVRLTMEDWIELGERSGVPRKRASVLAVQKAWLDGTARAPPLLELIAPDRYTLSKAHAEERTFLEESGRHEIERSRNGRRRK